MPVKKVLSKKLAEKWEGPFVVVEKVSDVNYAIRQQHNIKAKIQITHHKRLKRLFGNPGRQIPDTPSPTQETTEAPQRKKRGRKAKWDRVNKKAKNKTRIKRTETAQPVIEKSSKNVTELGVRQRSPVVKFQAGTNLL